MVVGIGAGPDKIEGIGSSAFVREEGIPVVASPPLYDEPAFTKAVLREAALIHGVGGERVRQGHERAARRFEGQLLEFEDRHFFPNGGNDNLVRATAEELHMQRDILRTAAELDLVII